MIDGKTLKQVKAYVGFMHRQAKKEGHTFQRSQFYERCAHVAGYENWSDYKAALEINDNEFNDTAGNI